MKIRNGFVSNSSSSSFVIRGIRASRRELESLLGEDFENILYKHKLTMKYEEYGDRDEVVVGVRNLGYLEDGSILELTDKTIKEKDAEVSECLKNAGIAFEDLSTFISYSSNG